jgi:hypothetical protein
MDHIMPTTPSKKSFVPSIEPQRAPKDAQPPRRPQPSANEEPPLEFLPIG